MNIRKVAAGRGAGWITDGIAVFWHHPGAYIQACLLIGLLSSLPIFGILVGLATPIFYGGLLSLLHRQAGGGVATASQAFDGFQRPGAFARLLPIALFNIAVAIVVVIVLAIVLGTAIYPLFQSDQSLETHPELLLPLLPKLLGLFAVILPLGIIFGWLMLLAIPHAMLDEVPGMTALADAWKALRMNWLPLLVNLLCLLLVMCVLIVLMFLPLALVGLLQQHAKTLGFLLQTLAMTVLSAGVLMLYCAIMYQAWADIFGADSAPSADDRIML